MGANSEMHIAMQYALMDLAHRNREGEIGNLDALLEMRGHRAEIEKSLAIIKEFEDERMHAISDEAQGYPEGYKGFMVTVTNGRKTFNFKGIPEWEEKNVALKTTEEKYKAMWEARQKITASVFADEETGEELLLPEVNYGKSFLTVKEVKRR